MSYQAGNLSAGTILLMTEVHPCNILDRLITWSEVSPFDHSGMVVETPQGLRIAEALWHIQLSPLDKYQQNGWPFTVTGLTPEQLTTMSQWALAHVGQQYGWAEILGNAARLDLKLPILARWQPQHWTCSQFVTDAFAQAGITLSLAPLVTPANLADSPVLVGPRPWTTLPA